MLCIEFTSKILFKVLPYSLYRSLVIYKTNVHNIKYIYLGAYVPLTKEGKIIVDGVLFFCYPGTHHDLAHLVMTPMRFSTVMEWIFGDDSGLTVYVSTARELGIMSLPDGHLLSD